MRRFFKYLFYTIASLVVLLAGLVMFTLFGPMDNYVLSTSYRFPGTELKLSVELKPIHRFLAEFERKLVLSGSKQQRIEQPMFVDSGGYTRTNLYAMPDGSFLVKGFFDGWLIQTKPVKIVEVEEAANLRATFLGAFDWTSDREWRFIPAAERAEQTLVPHGG
jgi:hypothetical protein